MAARPREPWSFEDGPEVAERIQREYGHALLASLPRPPAGAKVTPVLTDGYRIVTLAVRRSGERRFGPPVRVHLVVRGGAAHLVGVER